MQSEWITHKGKRIFYSNLSGFHTDVTALGAEIDESDTVICQQPENSILVLVDVRGSVGSTEVVQLFKDSSIRTKKYVRKTAVIGISGFRKVLLDAITRFSGRNATTFDDLDAAKDWLAGPG